MSIQNLLRTEQELLQSIKQHEAILQENKMYQILLNQTERFSLPFIEAIGMGFLIIWVASLGILPPLVLIFTEPIFAFGFAVILLIPINLVFSRLVRKFKQTAIEQGNLVDRAHIFFQEKSKFWDEIFKQEASERLVPSKEEIIEILLEENSSVLLNSPLGILTLIRKENLLTIEETPTSFDVYGKLLAIESNTKPTSQNISRLFVSHPYVFKCNKKTAQSTKDLLPEHSDTLRLLKEITNLISQNTYSNRGVL
jgi:hypothetical protein